MSQSDPDLLSFAREGCPDAFRRLVERHVDGVHSTAARLLRDWPADAADVAQAVFVLLARKASRLGADIVVAVWLQRQTVRLALNARRSDARRAARERTAHDLLAMNADDPHDASAALHLHVDEAIHALPGSDGRMIPSAVVLPPQTHAQTNRLLRNASLSFSGKEVGPTLSRQNGLAPLIISVSEH